MGAFSNKNTVSFCLKALLYIVFLTFWFATISVLSLSSKWLKRRILWVVPFAGLMIASNALGAYIASFWSAAPFGGINYEAILWATKHIKVFHTTLAAIASDVMVVGFTVAAIGFVYGLFADVNFQYRRAASIQVSYLLWFFVTLTVALIFKSDLGSLSTKIMPLKDFTNHLTPKTGYDAALITAKETRAIYFMTGAFLLTGFNMATSGLLLMGILQCVQNPKGYIQTLKSFFHIPSLSGLQKKWQNRNKGPGPNGTFERELVTYSKDRHGNITKFPVIMYADKDVRQMEDWKAFEHCVAGVLRRRYGAAWVVDDLKASGQVKLAYGAVDQGVDVIVEMKNEETGKVSRMVVQCKYYSKAVGNDAVQQIHTAKNLYGAEYAMLITNHQVTAACQQLAESVGVYIKTGLDVRNMVKESPATMQVEAA